MKHFLILLITALVTLSIVFIIYRPDLVEHAWLWVIGLAGPVIGWGKRLVTAARLRIKLFGKQQ